MTWVRTGGNRLIDASLDQFGADAVLQIITDISLAHGGAHGHRRCGVAIMVFGEFIHCCMDHADLRGVAVHDSYLPAFLYKICDHFRGLGGCGLLLGKVGPSALCPSAITILFFAI